MDHGALAALDALVVGLAEIFAREGRPGGVETSQALLSRRDFVPTATPKPDRKDAAIRAILADCAHPVAKAALAAHSILPWTATGVDDAMVPSEISSVFSALAIIGPGNMIDHPTVRAGLYFQEAATYYPLHSHSAEETYVVLGGHALWSAGPVRDVARGTGSFIFHPPFVAHASRTENVPLFAAWRWTGDIRTSTYRMVSEADAG